MSKSVEALRALNFNPGRNTICMCPGGIVQVPRAEWSLAGKPRGRLGAGRALASTRSQPSRRELMGA